MREKYARRSHNDSPQKRKAHAMRRLARKLKLAGCPGQARRLSRKLATS